PLPPNRTGGSPASGSPVSGFVVLRLSASTHVLLPRTAAHGGQTIHSASVDGWPRSPGPLHPIAIAAYFAAAVAHTRPPRQTCSLGCAGSIDTTRASSGSRPPRWRSSSVRPAARSAHAPGLLTSSG